ncbi:MAG TPA: hypothetical protein VFK34_00590 [Marmoricola sp.]|jgi:hypothetical protein|nr:hypothetical protein [Marmoricola sp.]
MATGSSTTDHLSAEKAGKVAWTVKGAGLGVLVLVVLAAAVGLLGPTQGQLRDSSGDYTLQVDYPRITRAGQPAPLRIRVHQEGGFDGPITLALSREMFDDMDFQNWYPNPSAETARARTLIYEFDPPDGEDFEVRLDARTAPGQFGGVVDSFVVLLVADQPAAEVHFKIWRMP